MLQVMMPKKKVEQAEKLTLNKDELHILDEVLTDYKGMVEYTYKHNVAIIAQGERMLKESTDKQKTLDLVKMLEEYKEQSKVLDIARLRADWLHLKVKESLGIKDEGDESTKSDGTRTEQDGSASDESDAEVSEGSEVLHQN